MNDDSIALREGWYPRPETCTRIQYGMFRLQKREVYPPLLHLQQTPRSLAPFGQRFLVHAVMNEIALLVRCNDVRGTQYAKVLRDRRSRDLQGAASEFWIAHL
jgi:hypothetical protein